MAKFTKITLDTLRNDATAVAAINENFARLETLLEQMLSRDGTSPNAMNALLDMNQQRMVNLPFPLSPTEPVRLQDITDATSDLAELMEDSEALLEEANTVAASILPQMEAYADSAEADAASATADAATATTKAAEAAASATAAANSAASFIASSSTSLSIGTGTKVFTTQAGKYFNTGAIVLASRSGGAGYMYGTVTSYSDTTLTLNVTATSGSGTYTDWILSVSGIPGPQGPQGDTGPGGPGSGDVTGPASAVDDHIVLFNGTTGKLLKSSGVAIGALASLSTINDSLWSGTDLSLANGGTGSSLTDPGADRGMFWDDSAGAIDWLTFGNGLAVSGTTLSVSAGSGISVSGGSVAISDAELLAIAALTSSADKIPYFTGSGTAALADFSEFTRTLTGAANAAAARSTLGLGNVDNTSDANKPISTATQNALNLKAEYARGFNSVNYTTGTVFLPVSTALGKLNILAAETVYVYLLSDAQAPGIPSGSVMYFYFQTNNVIFLEGAGSATVAPFGTRGVGGGIAVATKIGANFWNLQGAVTAA